MEFGKGPFRKTLRATLVISILLMIVGGVGLFGVSWLEADESFVCSGSPRGANVEESDPTASEGGGLVCTVETGKGLSSSVATAASTVSSTILAVGVVSMLVDVGLRRRFGEDLYRYLGLKEALVTTGLSDAGRASGIDLRSRLDALDELRYLGRSPALFLSEQMPALLRLAEKRRLRVTFGLPDPDNGDLMESLGTSTGLKSDVLSEAIRAFTNSLTAQWGTVADRVVSGTSFRVVYVTSHVPFEVCSATTFAFVGLGRPYGHGTSDDYLMTVFESAAEFPSSWIAESLAELDQIPAAWEDSKK